MTERGRVDPLVVLGTGCPKELPAAEGWQRPLRHLSKSVLDQCVQRCRTLASTYHQEDLQPGIEPQALAHLPSRRLVIRKGSDRTPGHRDGTLGARRQRGRGLLKGQVYLCSPPREQARGQPRPGILLLQDQRNAGHGGSHPGRGTCVPARHDDKPRPEASEEATGGRDGARQCPGDSQVREQPTPAETPDRKQFVRKPLLGKHTSLEPPTGAEEERPDIRPLPYQLVGEGERGVEVPAGASTREHGDKPVMHGPSPRR